MKKNVSLIMLLAACAAMTIIAYKAINDLSQLDLDNMFSWEDDE